MTIKTYTIAGEEFSCRVIKDNQDSDLIIGSLELEAKLHPGEFGEPNDGFANKEAENIYDEVFYFTDATNLELSDDALIQVLRRDNPEWF